MKKKPAFRMNFRRSVKKFSLTDCGVLMSVGALKTKRSDWCLVSPGAAYLQRLLMAPSKQWTQVPAGKYGKSILKAYTPNRNARLRSLIRQTPLRVVWVLAKILFLWDLQRVKLWRSIKVMERWPGSHEPPVKCSRHRRQQARWSWHRPLTARLQALMRSTVKGAGCIQLRCPA